MLARVMSVDSISGFQPDRMGSNPITCFVHGVLVGLFGASVCRVFLPGVEVLSFHHDVCVRVVRPSWYGLPGGGVDLGESFFERSYDASTEKTRFGSPSSPGRCRRRELSFRV